MHLKYEIFPAGGYRGRKKKKSCLYSLRRVRKNDITCLWWANKHGLLWHLRRISNPSVSGYVLFLLLTVRKGAHPKRLPGIEGFLDLELHLPFHFLFLALFTRPQYPQPGLPAVLLGSQKLLDFQGEGNFHFIPESYGLKQVGCLRDKNELRLRMEQSIWSEIILRSSTAPTQV